MQAFFHFSRVFSVFLAGGALLLWAACGQRDDMQQATIDNLNTALRLERNAALAAEVYASGVEDKLGASAEIQKPQRIKLQAASRLLRAVALSETLHARMLEDLARERGWKIDVPETSYPAVHDIEVGVRMALQGEDFEGAVMLPAFIKTARAAKEEGAAVLFERITAAEREQVRLLSEWLNGASDVLENRAYWVCQGCGNISDARPDAACVLCGAPASQITQAE